jgi:hypothetical protein
MGAAGVGRSGDAGLDLVPRPGSFITGAILSIDGGKLAGMAPFDQAHLELRHVPAVGLPASAEPKLP